MTKLQIMRLDLVAKKGVASVMMSTVMNEAYATKTFCYVGNEISPRRLLTDSAVTELVMVSVGQIC